MLLACMSPRFISSRDSLPLISTAHQAIMLTFNLNTSTHLLSAIFEADEFGSKSLIPFLWLQLLEFSKNILPECFQPLKLRWTMSTTWYSCSILCQDSLVSKFPSSDSWLSNRINCKMSVHSHCDFQIHLDLKLEIQTLFRFQFVVLVICRIW